MKRFLTSLAVAAIWIAMPGNMHPVGAADETADDDRIWFYSRIEPELRDGPYVAVGQDAAPWLPRVLDILQEPRGGNYLLEQVALFTGAQGQLYLVVNWDYGLQWTDVHNHLKNIIEFYRADVDEAGRVHLTTLREIRAWYAELMWQSGAEVFPGEPPVAVIRFSNGGSSAGNSGYRLIQLKRSTVDITPDSFGRTDGIRDVDDDGTFEVRVSDGRWGDKFDNGGPYVATILERQDGVFVPACREHAAYFQRSIESHEAWIVERDGWPYRDLGGILFDNLQIGDLAAAHVAYDQLRIETRPNHSQYVRGEADVVRDYGPVLVAAESLLDEQCILAAMTLDMMGDSFFARPARFKFHNWLPPELLGEDEY